MDLKSFIKANRREALTAWIPFKGGFEVNFEYTGQKELSKMAKKATVFQGRDRAGQRIDAVDEDRLGALMVEKIMGWRGLTLGKLAELMNVDPGPEPDTEIPFSIENAIELMDEVSGFAVFVSESLLDITLYRDEVERDELKN